jgi:hypothetical protein
MAHNVAATSFICNNPKMNWATFWSAASAIVSMGVLVFTGVYVWLTYRLARVAENQAWETSRARMSVSVGSNQGGQLFLLEFENVGGSPAQDLKVSINTPIHQQLGKTTSITEAPFFRDGIRALPPQRPVKFALGVAFRWLDDKTDRSLHPSVFDVTVSYVTLGREVTEVFPINMEQQFSLSAVDKDYVEEFGRTFPEKFERSMRELSRTINLAAEPAKEIPAGRRSWPKWFAKQVADQHRWDRYS